MHIGEDDDFTPVVRELGEGALEDASEVTGFGACLGGWGVIDGVERGAVRVVASGIERCLWAAGAFAEFVAGEVGDDGEEPGLEAAAFEAIDATPGADEGFLSGVFGGLWGAEHAEGEGVDGVLEAEDEGVEGGEIATLGALNQRVEFVAV